MAKNGQTFSKLHYKLFVHMIFLVLFSEVVNYQCLISFFLSTFCRFSYAIVGINLTSVLYELLKKQTLRTHFYNIKDDKPSLHDFHELYCKYL